MPSIFIEANDAGFIGLPIGSDHLYLVYRTDSGEEFVIGAGPQSATDVLGGDFAFDINEPIETSGDARGSDTPSDRYSTELNFPSLTADEAWSIMVAYAVLLDTVDYPYFAPSTNSNAFVGALLEAAGVDPSFSPPSTSSLLGPVGYDSSSTILSDISPPADGIIRGTVGDDVYTDGTEGAPGGPHGEVFRTFFGEDVIFAGGGDDRIEGEPRRVYRRVSGSIVMPLSQRRSSLLRMPPLSLVA